MKKRKTNDKLFTINAHSCSSSSGMSHCLLDGENGLMLAVSGSSALLCTGIAFGRSATFGVFGGKPLTFDRIDLRMSLLRVAGVAEPFSSDDFLMSVLGVAGVSNSFKARTFRYGGDSKCIFDCINVVCRNGRIIVFPVSKKKIKQFMSTNQFMASQ